MNDATESGEMDAMVQQKEETEKRIDGMVANGVLVH